ncbi:rod-binding protein [Sphingomonas xinjiangensis]|uniref:Rod binding domain-containing protein n=1 Tax=Sphingomonas xinjiangensis TaxID=643568 RepID=A0A840YM41_9SPHN|nr:rod-binding protein [Sphingomonas xinjiangensis]MBB5710756.1 Rod binding domain-containing protein [Sphingomonas xinjiangensis]
MNDISPVSLPAAPAKPMPKVDAKNQQTAKDFEAVFLGQMTQLMMSSVQQDGDFNGGAGEEMFRGILAEKLGTEIAKRGGIGLAPVVLDQIIKLQGK